MAAEPWPSQHLQLVSVIINQGWGGFSVASGQGAFLSPFSQEVGRQQGGLGQRRSTQPRLQLAIGLPSDAQLSAEGLGCFPRAGPKRISELPELVVVLWPPHACQKHLRREVHSPQHGCSDPNAGFLQLPVALTGSVKTSAQNPGETNHGWEVILILNRGIQAKNTQRLGLSKTPKKLTLKCF